MRLSAETVKDITLGAVSVREENGALRFFRFTREEFGVYEGGDLYDRLFSASGIKFSFVTDSTFFAMRFETLPSSHNEAFMFDICINGKSSIVCANITPDGFALFSDGTKGEKPFPFGKHETGVFGFQNPLPAGEKEIVLTFPWSVEVRLLSAEISDGAYIKPLKRKLKMLSYGDSITCGHDCKNPALSYAERLARSLDAEVFNKGIGTGGVVPAQALCVQPFKPDLITVAYGVNDWATKTRDKLIGDFREFFGNLTSLYPDVPVFCITPITCGEKDKDFGAGTLSDVRRDIENTVSGYKNVTVINGGALLPEDFSLFNFDKVHPNDEGFGVYADSLKKFLTNCEL